MKVDVKRDMVTDAITVVGTPEQEEIRATSNMVRDAVVRLLTDQYIKKFGVEVLDAIDPSIIADEVKRAVARRLYEHL